MKTTDWKVFCWLCARTGKRFVGIGLMTVVQMVNSLAGVLFALLCRRVIDQASFGEGRELLQSGGMLVGVLFLQMVCCLFLRMEKPLLEARLNISLQQRILHLILNGDYEKVSGYHTGSLMSRIQGDVGAVSGWLTSVIPGVSGMLVRLAGAFVVLCMLDVKFTLTMTAVCLAVALAAGLYRRKIKVLVRAVQDSGEKLIGYYQELFANLLVVRAFRAESRMEERAGRLLGERYRLYRRRAVFGAVSGTGMRLAFQGAYGAGVLWCVLRISQGFMSYGTLTAVLQLLHQLQSPMTGLSGVMGQTWSMLVSAERLMELESLGADLCEAGESRAEVGNRKPVPQEAAGDLLPCCRKAVGSAGADFLRIEAKDLSFAYTDHPVFRNISFEIQKGDFILLKGESGSGKTTLLKLLMGIYPQNAIWLVTESGREPLGSNPQELFTYVPQGNLLFSGTVRDNICFMSGANPTEEQLEKVLKESCVSEYLERLPDGLDTVVGERGFGLSEGQVQRIAIARALMSDAPVIILDEATSALDEELETRILNNLRRLPGKTCLIASHRPAAEQFCNRIWEIRNGNIQRRQR